MNKLLFFPLDKMFLSMQKDGHKSLITPTNNRLKYPIPITKKYPWNIKNSCTSMSGRTFMHVKGHSFRYSRFPEKFQKNTRGICIFDILISLSISVSEYDTQYVGIGPKTGISKNISRFSEKFWKIFRKTEFWNSEFKIDFSD